MSKNAFVTTFKKISNILLIQEIFINFYWLWNRLRTAQIAVSQCQHLRQQLTLATVGETSSGAILVEKCTIETFWRTIKRSSIVHPSASIARKCSRKRKSRIMLEPASWSLSFVSIVSSTFQLRTSMCTSSNVNLELLSAHFVRRQLSIRSMQFIRPLVKESQSLLQKMLNNS